MQPIASQVPAPVRQQKLESLLGRLLKNRGTERAETKAAPVRVVKQEAPRPIATPANWSALDRKGRLSALLDRVVAASRRS